MTHLARLGVELPQQLRRMMGEMERGNLQVGVRPEGFDALINRFERTSNRIVLGVIAAAFINGLAVLMSVYRPPGWERWAWVVFAFGFLCALALGVYLAWSRPKKPVGASLRGWPTPTVESVILGVFTHPR